MRSSPSPAGTAFPGPAGGLLLLLLCFFMLHSVATALFFSSVLQRNHQSIHACRWSFLPAGRPACLPLVQMRSIEVGSLLTKLIQCCGAMQWPRRGIGAVQFESSSPRSGPATGGLCSLIEPCQYHVPLALAAAVSNSVYLYPSILRVAALFLNKCVLISEDVGPH